MPAIFLWSTFLYGTGADNSIIRDIAEQLYILAA